MKRFMLFTLVIGLFAVQADAALWELDEPTALQFRTTSITGGVEQTPLGIWSPRTTAVWGSALGADGISGTADDLAYGQKMSGAVGFAATVNDNNLDGTVIYSVSAGGDAGLTGTTGYGGIKSYFQNDNQSIWLVELFYVDVDADGTSGTHSSGYVPLAGDGGSTWLTVNDPDGATGLEFDDITDIGFRIKGINMGSGGAYPSTEDTWHMSVVPVPGAVLLGILGLGAAGLKLRKFA